MTTKTKQLPRTEASLKWARMDWHRRRQWLLRAGHATGWAQYTWGEVDKEVRADLTSTVEK